MPRAVRIYGNQRAARPGHSMTSAQDRDPWVGISPEDLVPDCKTPGSLAAVRSHGPVAWREMGSRTVRTCRLRSEKWQPNCPTALLMRSSMHGTNPPNAARN